MFNLNHYDLCANDTYLSRNIFNISISLYRFQMARKSEPVVFYSSFIKDLPFYLLELPSQMLVIDSLNGVFQIIEMKDDISFIFFDSIHCRTFLYVPYNMEISSRILGVNWSLSIEALFSHLSHSLSISLLLSLSISPYSYHQ